MRREYIDCDRCKLPIKGKVWFFCVVSEETFYSPKARQVLKDEGGAEICSNCKKLIEEVLEYRTKKLAYFQRQIDKMFSLKYNKKKKGKKKNV